MLAATRTNTHALGRALSSVNPWWIAAAFALMVATFLARGESWFVVVRIAIPDVSVWRRTVTRALMIGMATSAVAPGRVGEAVRAWVLALRLGSVREHLGTVVGTVIAQTLMNLLALAALTVAAIVGGGAGGGQPSALLLVFVLPALLVVGVLLAPVLVATAARWPVVARWRIMGWLTSELRRVRLGVAAMSASPRSIRAVAAQLTAWALQLGCCYMTLHAFDIRVRNDLAVAAGVLAATNLTAIVPLTPSNVGIFQATCIAVLARVGVPASHGLAYGLVLQAVEVLCALAMGGAALLGEGLSWRQLQTRPAPNF